MTSIVAFVPAVLVALTCGLCNTCATAMYLDPSIGAYDAGPGDAGMAPNRTLGAPPPFPTGPTPGLAAPTTIPRVDPSSAPPSLVPNAPPAGP